MTEKELKDYYKIPEGVHFCVLPEESEIRVSYGKAIDVCYEENNKLYVDNNEYISQINYCPICGFKAKVQILEK